MMHNAYRDVADGNFVPDITIRRRDDNGHYEASANGMTETHHLQDVAVNKLTTRLQDAITKGDIHP